MKHAIETLFFVIYYLTDIHLALIHSRFFDMTHFVQKQRFLESQFITMHIFTQDILITLYYGIDVNYHFSFYLYSNNTPYFQWKHYWTIFFLLNMEILALFSSHDSFTCRMRFDPNKKLVIHQAFNLRKNKKTTRIYDFKFKYLFLQST